MAGRGKVRLMTRYSREQITLPPIRIPPNPNPGPPSDPAQHYSPVRAPYSVHTPARPSISPPSTSPSSNVRDAKRDWKIGKSLLPFAASALPSQHKSLLPSSPSFLRRRSLCISQNWRSSFSRMSLRPQTVTWSNPWHETLKTCHSDFSKKENAVKRETRYRCMLVYVHVRSKDMLEWRDTYFQVACLVSPRDWILIPDRTKTT